MTADWTPEDEATWQSTFERQVRGEVRLGHQDDEDLLSGIGDWIDDEDEIPDPAKDGLKAHVRSRLAAERAILASETAEWPKTTDCDRLDAAIASLQDDGIVLWAVSPCCNTCTMAEFPDYVEFLAKEDAGLETRLRGYAYFIEQNMADSLAEGTDIHVYLGYGSTRGEEGDAYPSAALAIGREVVAALDAAGLTTDWPEDLGKKIQLSLDWKRRPE